MRHEMTNDETGALAAIPEAVGVRIDLTIRKICPLSSDVREYGVRA
jgi:acyl-CoA thioesterase FadM